MINETNLNKNLIKVNKNLNNNTTSIEANNLKDNKDNIFAKSILTILSSIKNIKKEKLKKDEYFLVNKYFIFKFKELFSNDKYEQLVEKWEDKIIPEFLNNKKTDKEFEKYINFIISKKNDDLFNPINNKDFLKIKKGEIKNKNNIYYYPTDFFILNKETYLNLLKIMTKKRNDMWKDEICLNVAFDNGQILLKFISDNFNNKVSETNYLYKYTLIEKDNKPLDYYKPELILSFPNVANKINYFENIIKGTKIKKENEIKDSFIFENQTIKIIRINNENDDKNKINNNEIKKEQNDKEEKILKFIKYALILDNGYKSLNNKIKELLNDPLKVEPQTIFYLINKNYMKELKSFLNYEEIKKLIKDNKNKFTTDFKENEENYLKEVKGLLKEKSINNIRDLQEINLQKNKNENSISELPKKEYIINNNKKESFFIDCQIINKEIFDLIKKIDNKICEPKNIVECYISWNIVFTKFDDNLINIGKVDNNNIILVEKILYSKVIHIILKI